MLGFLLCFSLLMIMLLSFTFVSSTTFCWRSGLAGGKKRRRAGMLLLSYEGVLDNTRNYTYSDIFVKIRWECNDAEMTN